MQRQRQARNGNRTMQQTAFLETDACHILIVRSYDGKAREDRIAVVAMVIHHVVAVGMIGPDPFSEKFVLRLHRPVNMLRRVPQVLALHLLQENDVSIQRTQALAQFMHHHAAVELRETLVDVPGGDGEHLRQF